MHIIQLIQKHRKAGTREIKDFIYKNMNQEMIRGLEYDDPQTIKRALKLFGIEETMDSINSHLPQDQNKPDYPSPEDN